MFIFWKVVLEKSLPRNITDNKDSRKELQDSFYCPNN